MTSDKHLDDRLGAVLFRLSSLERRAAAAGESPRLGARLVDDVRRLAGDLERAFADVRELLAERARMRTELALAVSRSQLLFDMMPGACVCTDVAGAITEANTEAVRLLNISRRHLVGRSFHLYLGAQREVFLRKIQALGDGETRDVWRAPVRPRERSPLHATLTAIADPSGGVIILIQPDAPLGKIPHATVDTQPREHHQA